MLTQIQKDLIDFDYTREPLLTEVSQALAGLDAIRNTSDQKVLGVFKSDQYIISHSKAVEKVESAFEEMGMLPDTTNFQLLKNGSQLYVHYRLPEALNIDLGENLPGVPGSDILCPEVILRNGYDGKTIFGLEYGLHRLVCANGMRTMVLGDRATAKMYLGDIDVAVIVGGMREFCNILLLNLKTRIEMMVVNTTPSLNEETRNWLIEHFSNKLLGIYDQQIAEIVNNVGLEKLNEWLIYNVLTNITTYQMKSYARRRSVELMLAKRFNITVAPTLIESTS